jgi:hypothetical protein
MPNAMSIIPRCSRSPAWNVDRVNDPSCDSVVRVTSSNEEAVFPMFCGFSMSSICFMPNIDIAHEKLISDLVRSRIRPLLSPRPASGEPVHGP